MEGIQGSTPMGSVGISEGTAKMMSIAYIAAILIVVFVLYKILSAIGIIKTRKREKKKEEIEQAATDLRKMEYFNPLYLKGKTGYRPLGAIAGEYVKILRKGLRGLGTNEEAIYGTFSQLKNRENIGELALIYRKNYGRSLINDILRDLTKKEKVILLEIINKLPMK